VLAEAGLVPGALLRNRNLRFLGRDVHVVAERVDTPFTRALSGDRRPLRLPIAHGEGCWYADDATIAALEADGQVLFRYVHPDGRAAGSDPAPSAGTDAAAPAETDAAANPNGSLRAIAGVLAAGGNVAGLMPHPERAVEGILGSDDGLAILRSLVESAAERAAGPALVGVGAQ
jgi:phosphoribosylformylglycinamidine synthase